LLAGLLLRLPGIDTPSIEQRENQSSIFARGWYLGEGEGLPAAQQRVLAEVDTVLEPFEPPLLELAAAGFDRTIDDEVIWFPRLLSALAWIAGGAFLALIGRRIMGAAGVLTAVALYLVWPYAAWHSRKFMPDALMVSCLLGAVLLTIRYWERPSRGRLAAAGGAAAVATAIKPGVAFFFVVAVFAGLALSHGRLRKETRSGRLPLFVGLAASLAVLYVAVGRYATDFINPDATTGRVTPDLVVTSGFWRGWWDMVSFLLRSPQTQGSLAVVPLAVGLLGLVLAPKGTPRTILLSLVAGYVAFALAVATYTATHPYYALPLIPILSLAIGVVVSRAYDALAGRRIAQAAVALSVAAIVGVGAWKAHALITTPAKLEVIADYERIGELTRHTTRAIVVDDNLAHPIMYWGWIVAQSWELDYNKTLPPWIDPDEQDYVIVVGNHQFDHVGLRDFTRDLPVVERTDRHTIFDLRGDREASG
jgi:Dolichyl-phosphate-mannose-protein mannosyltransferase